MIQTKKGILIALIFPIIALALLAGYKKYILSVGTEVTLPIKGYDPRDLLSGHYLIYTIDYGVEGLCGGITSKIRSSGYVCLSNKKFSSRSPYNCELMIEGTCNGVQFEAGIERYYVAEEEATKLEDLVRSNEASIVLSVTKGGKAQIKDLLINGKPWRDQ